MDLVKGQYDAHRPVAASAVRSGQKDSTWLGALSTGEDAHHHQVAASVDLDGEQCADKGAGSDQVVLCLMFRQAADIQNVQ